jgi:hypothetical protein
MASKSKDIRLEQLRLLEKKLALRLEKIAQKGISKEKAQKDPLIKNLKSKIRETHVRIAASDKLVQLTQALAQAKVQKLADLAANKEKKPEQAQDEKKAESKPKKKEAAADQEPKKQPAEKVEKASKEPKKQAAALDEETPKKPKKQPADGDEAAPKKRTSKKKEE